MLGEVLSTTAAIWWSQFYNRCSVFVVVPFTVEYIIRSSSSLSFLTHKLICSVRFCQFCAFTLFGNLVLIHWMTGCRQDSFTVSILSDDKCCTDSFLPFLHRFTERAFSASLGGCLIANESAMSRELDVVYDNRNAVIGIFIVVESWLAGGGWRLLLGVNICNYYYYYVSLDEQKAEITW